ncbi:hypothetical protein SAY86_001861 [Trapa natans]|uniref:DUF7642 domain-containing protein n=1 Tax=Trapa natans TaxID=22666 RepID=A0AAN7LEM2_TRANT|nr:hypothetical protein SAY86_001861 [Trapa natans]
MGSDHDEVEESDALEKGLLAHDGSQGCQEGEEDPVLYTATFQEMEENFVKYQTARWVLYSLLLILAWGIGIFMLLYLPVRRYILRKDIRSRKLYITPYAIVYKATKPVSFPCFGVLKKEKHVLLPSVADILIEQGYFQSLFGVYSLRIENVGVRRSPRDDVQIQGIANPNAFRKAVLARLSTMKNEAFSKKVLVVDDVPNLQLGASSASWMSPSRSLPYDNLPSPGEQLLLQKLEEVGTSMKRVQRFMEDQQTQAPSSLE